MLLPNGPLARALPALGINAHKYLYLRADDRFSAMALFTFPFMVMNIGAALSNVDPMLEEAAKTLGAQAVADFHADPLPVELERHNGRLSDVLRLESRRLRRADPARRSPQAAAVLSLDALQKAMVQFDYGLAAAMGIVLMVMAFAVTWVSLEFSRGALGA